MFDKPAIQEKAVHSPEETAKLLGVSLSTVKRLTASGELTVSRPDGLRRVFIKGSRIMEMLDRTEVKN